MLQRLHLRRRNFTLANTGLSKPSEFGEFGSVWKAAEIKVILWYLTKKASELAEGGNAACMFLQFWFYLQSLLVWCI